MNCTTCGESVEFVVNGSGQGDCCSNPLEDETNEVLVGKNDETLPMFERAVRFHIEVSGTDVLHNDEIIYDVKNVFNSKRVRVAIEILIDAINLESKINENNFEDGR